MSTIIRVVGMHGGIVLDDARRVGGQSEIVRDIDGFVAYSGLCPFQHSRMLETTTYRATKRSERSAICPLVCQMTFA